jgi:cobalamin biosynthesis Mg chelatase CobN
MYVGEMRINHSERLKLAKQKAVNKANKLRQAAEVISRVLAMQYEREAADEDIEAAEADVASARTAVEKADEEVTKYTRLEQEVIASIREDKRLAEEEDRAYEACIDRGIMQPLWSKDGDYISPYDPHNINDFAPRYRLQRYRYTKPRVDPLAFLDDSDDLDEVE